MSEILDKIIDHTTLEINWGDLGGSTYKKRR